MPIKVILLLLAITNFCVAQNTNWVPLSSGLNDAPRILFSDSVSGKLYIGGNFNKADNLSCNRICSWDGSSFDSLGEGKDGVYVLAITNYQNEIYVGGSFTLSTGMYNGLSISKWNGSNWQDVPGSLGHFGSIDGFFLYNNELVATGQFDSIGSEYSPLITRFDGTGFNAFNNSPCWYSLFSHVSCSVIYDGALYFGGGFDDTSNTLYNLVKYDGSNWTLVGNSVSGLATYVSSMVEYHNELYIAGRFFKSDGNVGNNIMKWDGHNLSDVANGTDNVIYSMVVFNDKLFVAGGFNTAGGILASNIAAWDGNSWSSLGTEIFDNNITTITIHNGELYAGGGFLFIDNVSVNRIAKYTGPLALHETLPIETLNISPNPVSNELTIHYTHLLVKTSFSIFNTLGETILNLKEENGTGLSKRQINLSNFSKGVYFIKVQNEEGIIVRKFVKE